MKRRIKSLFVIISLIAVGKTQAQIIDSFHVNTSVSPHELFVRLHFPDSSYYVERTFDRVAMIYPPVNIITFFYRSCEDIKNSPVMDTIIPIYTPEPYCIWVWLVSDINTTPGCMLFDENQSSDSASYYSETATGVVKPGIDSKIAFSIFPNPANGILYIEGASGCDFNIYDGLGRLMLKRYLKNEKEAVNISTLIPGIYYTHCYRKGILLQSCSFSKVQ